jgi:hypothetical protein
MSRLAGIHWKMNSFFQVLLRKTVVSAAFLYTMYWFKKIRAQNTGYFVRKRQTIG